MSNAEYWGLVCQCKDGFTVCVLMTEELARRAMEEWETWISAAQPTGSLLVLEGMTDTADRAERRAVILMEQIVTMDICRKWG